MNRTVRLRWIVAALVIAIVTPLGVLAVLSIQRAWRRQLTSIDTQNISTTRAISVAIDQYIENTSAALDVFGELHALDGPDFPAFESLAGRLLPYQPDWSAILVADTSGRTLDGYPDAADGHARVFDEPWASATVAAKRPTISSLFRLPGVDGWFVIIATPVVRQGRVTSVLGARVRSNGLSAILREQQAPPNGVVALTDAEYRIIARTRDEPSLVGKPANPELPTFARGATQGTWRSRSRDGGSSYAAFSRSPRSGLTVAVGLPSEIVDGPIRRILWIVAGAWATVLTLGAGLGLLLGQVIVRAMSSASSAAMALARGEPVAPAPSCIVEIDQLSASLRRAAETLEQRNRERDEASRLKDEFLMTVSHELRTPLTAICGWSRMLSGGLMREPQRTRAYEAIERNAQALQQLVDDLLDVSRIVAGKLRIDVQPVAPRELMMAAVDAIRPAADAKNIQLSTVVEPDCGQVIGDPTRLQQVMWNLLSNAVKFTPGGGRIAVECRPAGTTVELTFRDSGVGIEPQFLPFVFERFRQGASGTTRSHGGLGLGLSIVRDLVELHGGSVTVENNVPPPGATFRVVLPAAAQAATYSGAAGWSPSATSATSPTTPATSPTTPGTAAR